MTRGEAIVLLVCLACLAAGLATLATCSMQDSVLDATVPRWPAPSPTPHRTTCGPPISATPVPCWTLAPEVQMKKPELKE
jgi:hypothetical protein